MSGSLDDKEQTDFLREWEFLKRKKEKQIQMIRKAHADGAISLIEMEIAIWKVKRKHL